jgi:hypothetical protein
MDGIEDHCVKQVRLGKTNITGFLSYVEFRHKKREKYDLNVKGGLFGVETSRRRGKRK